MSDIYNKLQKYLTDKNIDGLYFNSSNEFLMEYNVPEKNSAYKLTNFSGSQSMGICAKDKVYLFVDTRYHTQADIEVKDNFIKVVKVPLTKSLTKAFFEILPDNFRLGVPLKKISKTLYETFSAEIQTKNGLIVPLNEDGIELFDCSYAIENDCRIFGVPTNISGISSDEKIKSLINKYKNSYIIITELSDIAYFTNLRSFDLPYSSSFPSKLIISPSGAVLYINNELNLNSELINLKYFSEFYEDLKKIKNSHIFYDNTSISMYDYSLIDKSNKIEKTDFSSAKSVKNKNEIEHLKKCFHSSDSALKIIENMLNSDKEYSEFDYSKALVESLYKHGAYSLSFKPIVACADNSAIIHYSSPSKDKMVKNGDFLLIDFGAYFQGGYATDTTRTFVKGNPDKLQKKVYTTVLKAFLNAYHRKSRQYFEIDKHARGVINKSLKKDFPFSHSTGHGVGINVHEVPPRISSSDISKIDIEENTVFTIEPGAYKLNFGGVRLENTVYSKKIGNKIKFITLSKYKFEEKLIDKTLLNSLELKWLQNWQAEYEKTYISE